MFAVLGIFDVLSMRRTHVFILTIAGTEPIWCRASRFTMLGAGHVLRTVNPDRLWKVLETSWKQIYDGTTNEPLRRVKRLQSWATQTPGQGRQRCGRLRCAALAVGPGRERGRGSRCAQISRVVNLRGQAIRLICQTVRRRASEVIFSRGKKIDVIYSKTERISVIFSTRGKTGGMSADGRAVIAVFPVIVSSVMLASAITFG